MVILILFLYLQKDVWSLDVLSLRTFSHSGRFVPPDVLSRRTFGRRTFRLSGRYVPPDVLSDRR
jgi:hypothetical protein